MQQASVAIMAPGVEAGSDRTRVHPNFLIRIAGEPEDGVHALTDHSSLLAWRAAAALRDRLKDEAVQVCAILAGVIPGLDDRRLSNRTLALRRDLFNLRPPTVDPIELARRLDADDLARLSLLVGEISALRRLEAALGETYDRELALGAALLRERFERPNLRDGVLYSSPNLYEKLLRLYGRELPRFSPREVADLETSFLAYYLRTAKKTSPQSSLTLFDLGVWRPGAGRSRRMRYASLNHRRQLALRRDLLQRLLAPALLDVAVLGSDFPLRLNPSLAVLGDRFQFVQIDPDGRGATPRLSGGRWNGALEVLRGVLATRGEATVGDLIAALAAKASPDAQGALTAFLQRLVAEQMLLPATRFEAQGDGLQWAIDVSARMATEKGRALHALVALLRGRLDACGAAEPATRVVAMQQLREALEAIGEATGAKPPAAMFAPFLHEDCRVDAEPVSLDPAALSPILDDLDAMLSWDALLDSNVRVQAWFAERFRATFGDEGVCFDPAAALLAASDECERILTSPRGEDDFAPGDVRRLPVCDPAMRQVEALTSQLKAHVRAAAAQAGDGGEARLDAAFIASLAAQIPETVARRPRSRCYLGHVLAEPVAGGPAFVLNQSFTGYSRLLSRFIDAGESTLPAVRAYLRDLAWDGQLVEVPGVFGFNANLHPQLADLELELAPFERNRLETPALRLSDLVMRYDGTASRVTLATRDGRQVDALFLGLMHNGLLPPLHRALDTLRSAAFVAWDIARELAFEGREPATEMRRTPRVRLGSLILARETWFVPETQLPDPAASDSEFFFAVQGWRAGLGLPEHVFMRLAPAWATFSEGTGREATQRRAPVARKPVYVDFSSPIVVRGLRKALRTHAGSVIFSEALPGRGDYSLHAAGDPHVVEIGIEVSHAPEMV